MKINSLNKINFIKSTDLLYAQRTGISKEDELFNNLTADFKLSKPVGGKIKCRKRKIKCRIFATNYLSFNLKLKL